MLCKNKTIQLSKQLLLFLLISCAFCFEIKSDENIVTYSSSNKPRIHFTIEKGPNEEIEELELIFEKQRVSIQIHQSNEYEIELPDSFAIESGRSLTFEISSVISEKKCSSNQDFDSIELVCEESERIQPISAKLGIIAQENENLENPTVCFAELNELWDSCSTDLSSFVSVRCSHLRKCSPFLQMDSISQRTNCDPLSDLFFSVSFKCLRHYSSFLNVCFQLDLAENDHFSASLIPDSDSYPLFKRNLVVFFTTTIPQQCESEDVSNSIDVFGKPSSGSMFFHKTCKLLSDSSTIYKADFGPPAAQTYTISVHFAERKLLSRTIVVSSSTVITSPPTPFEHSVSVSSSIVTFSWKKLNSAVFTSAIDFKCSEFVGIAYYHIGDKMTRSAAKNHCQKLDDSLLPTVRSVCRRDTLVSILGGRTCWFGLTDDARNVAVYDPVENTYRWDDGSTDFSMIGRVWKIGEPNNYNGNEHCYEFSKDGFNDMECEKTGIETRPICEKRNFDCSLSEPNYSILIFDENVRFLSQYRYNGDDIRAKEIGAKFTQEITDLENGKNYHYSIRSENCGVSKSTNLKSFKYCFVESPDRIEKTSYRVGVVSEIHSFSFPFRLPFFGIVCSDSESMKSIKISTNSDLYDCSANPSQFTIVPKTSLITCELKSNAEHSSSLSLDVLLSNSSDSESLTSISVLLCPFVAESCPSDCFEICRECSSFLDSSSCVSPCSWCSSSHSCLNSNAECFTETNESSSSLALILICVLIPVFVLLVVVVVVILFLRNRRRSTVDKLDAVLATTNITLEDSDFLM